MKVTLPLAIATLGLVFCVSADAQPAAPSQSKVCINSREIQRTETPDDRTIVFHMRDGKIWRNELRSTCPMLKTSPYSQVLHTDQICANQQVIRVAQSGYSCVLGDFTPVAAKP